MKYDQVQKIELNGSSNPKTVTKSEESQSQNDQFKTPEKGMVKPMPSNSNIKNTMANILLSLVVVAAGIGSGWGLSKVVAKPAEQSPEEKAMVDSQTIKVGDIYGNKEVNGFRDSAEGVLLDGGIEGEGSHRLLRPGGKTQTVYMTSSVIDLDPFIDHKVKVWGETFAAQKANWLMDVGRVEVVELDAELPFEE